MKNLLFILLLVTFISALALPTQGQDRMREGRGNFVRLTEVGVGDREYLGVIVKLPDREEPTLFLIPREFTDRNEEMMARARKLREGQIVELAFVTEGRNNWLRELAGVWPDGPDRPEPDRPREPTPDWPRDPEARFAQIEREMAALREENAQLRRQVAELRQGAVRRDVAPQPDRRREEPQRPDVRPDVRDGVVSGTFLRRTEVMLGDRGFLAVVVRPGERDEPVTLVVPRRNEDLMHVARQLREGQRVEVGWIQEEGQRWVRWIGR